MKARKKVSKASLLHKASQLVGLKPPPKRRLQAPVSFDRHAALKFMIASLEQPPALPTIKRPKRRGELVARFALPLELCPTTNSTRHADGRVLGRLKKALGEMMFAQHGGRAQGPLDGRPQVICRRFSSVETDPYSDWAKFAVDKLMVGKNRLGLIRDDKGSDIELHQVWEPAPPGEGFVIIEVRS